MYIPFLSVLEGASVAVSHGWRVRGPSGKAGGVRRSERGNGRGSERGGGIGLGVGANGVSRNEGNFILRKEG